MTNVAGAPSFKSLDGKMQKGYELLDQKDTAGACRVWLDAWNDFLSLYEESAAKSIEEFDLQFEWTQLLSNWVQDLEMHLWNAGLKDPQFLKSRISLCEEMLRRFGGDGENLRNENSRRAIAECYCELRQLEKVDAFYKDWLDSDPRWGWGWIGWSDCYHLLAPTESKDAERSECILRQGLSVTDVRDRDDILERLADLLRDMGRTVDAAEFGQQIDRKPIPPSLSFAASNPADKASFENILQALCVPHPTNAATAKRDAPSLKVDRHRPCQCGSGKMFKKCCGRGLR